ncbi:hypothetical protein BDV3_002806 [Batrachochytrium dendrobatidis]
MSSGMHIETALAGVPKEQRCVCPRNESSNTALTCYSSESMALGYTGKLTKDQ